MATEDLVMMIDKPLFTVRLHLSLLEVDLKEGIKKELEDFLEATQALRENLGFLFQTIIPLDVPLRNIESAKVDEKGQVRIVIPLRRDIIIPLEPEESKLLVEKLNELIPKEKEKFVRLLLEDEKERRTLERVKAEIIEKTKREEQRGR